MCFACSMSRKQNSPLTASLAAKQNSPLTSFVAGAVGGSIDACFTMPFDAVKTQIQRDPRMGALGIRCVSDIVGDSQLRHSGHRFDVKGNDDYVIHWGFTVSLAANDYIEVYWATGDTQLNLHTEAATSPHPGIPSASIDVSFVSNV